ncbi:MAG: flavin monoamine oxidase family protein [Ilumatobacteraceae bacterium]
MTVPPLEGDDAARVVVVGGGMAGLTAAYRLMQAGCRVVVLEAQDRIGGRVRSLTLENGAVAELGGEWIDSDQRFVSDLALELGVAMSPVGVDFSHRDPMGHAPIPISEHRRVAEAVSKAAESFATSAGHERTAAELLAEADDRSVAFTVLRRRLEGSAGVPLGQVAAGQIVGDFGVGESTYLRMDQGNEALARAIAEALPDVRTAQPVREIVTTDHEVEVRTSGGGFTADAVVVSVPLPIVSRIRFAPPLRSDLADAIASLAMGTAAKFVAPTVSTPPLLAHQGVDATWWCWTGASNGEVRNVVTGFAGTRTAIDTVSGDWHARLATVIPNIPLGAGVFLDWGKSEWSGGCYSSLGPGDEARLGAFTRESSVVFAGEHTLGAGTIDGAIESGERAATRLMHFLSRPRRG